MAVPRGSLDAQAPACGEEAIERVRAAAEPVRGARIVHLTPAGDPGRVPELLTALLPLAADVGVEVDWRVVFGSPALHGVGHALHEGLQGAETVLDSAAFDEYLGACAEAAEGLGDYDLLVLHDPGAVGIAAAAEGRVAWQCHLDASNPDRPALERVRPLLEDCEALVFPDESFAPEQLRGDRVEAIPPGIDPLSPGNLELAPRLAGRVVRPLGVDLGRPFVCQVMRFDRWKDPHSTLEAFSDAKEEMPEIQLVLAGALEADDADGWRAVKEVSDYAEGRPDVHVLTSYEGVGSLELGALQRLARVALQRSIREGFGLAASEALWKGTPVIGGHEGGLPIQVRDGTDGFLAGEPSKVAARIVELVRDPGLAIEMGEAGRERVRERFLVTRALEDELRLLARVTASGGATVNPG
jgi:trehalose synthase